MKYVWLGMGTPTNREATKENVRKVFEELKGGKVDLVSLEGRFWGWNLFDGNLFHWIAGITLSCDCT